MPNTQSAKKAMRSSLRKREINTVRKTKVKTSLKELRRVVSTNPTESQAALSKAFSALDKAAKSNFIPKQRVDRKKARLSALVAKATAK